MSASLSPHMLGPIGVLSPPFTFHYHRGNPSNHVLKVVDSKGVDVPPDCWSTARDINNKMGAPLN